MPEQIGEDRGESSDRPHHCQPDEETKGKEEIREFYIEGGGL